MHKIKHEKKEICDLKWLIIGSETNAGNILQPNWKSSAQINSIISYF